MESKQPPSTTQAVNPTSGEKQTGQHEKDISGHLADIELKLDHLIERIHDSLFRLKSEGSDDPEVEE